MSKAILARPAAREDMRAVVAHYHADSGPGIALAFADQLRLALARIGLGAEPGSAWLAQALDLPGLRVWRVARFPYLVLAIERPDHFDVLRLLHSKRDLPAAFAGR